MSTVLSFRRLLLLLLVFFSASLAVDAASFTLRWNFTPEEDIFGKYLSPPTYCASDSTVTFVASKETDQTYPGTACLGSGTCGSKNGLPVWTSYFYRLKLDGGALLWKKEPLKSSTVPSVYRAVANLVGVCDAFGSIYIGGDRHPKTHDTSITGKRFTKIDKDGIRVWATPFSSTVTTGTGLIIAKNLIGPPSASGGARLAEAQAAGGALSDYFFIAQSDYIRAYGLASSSSRTRCCNDNINNDLRWDADDPTAIFYGRVGTPGAAASVAKYGPSRVKIELSGGNSNPTLTEMWTAQPPTAYAAQFGVFVVKDDSSKKYVCASDVGNSTSQIRPKMYCYNYDTGVQVWKAGSGSAAAAAGFFTPSSCVLGGTFLAIKHRWTEESETRMVALFRAKDGSQAWTKELPEGVKISTGGKCVAADWLEAGGDPQQFFIYVSNGGMVALHPGTGELLWHETFASEELDESYYTAVAVGNASKKLLFVTSYRLKTSRAFEIHPVGVTTTTTTSTPATTTTTMTTTTSSTSTTTQEATTTTAAAAAAVTGSSSTSSSPAATSSPPTPAPPPEVSPTPIPTRSRTPTLTKTLQRTSSPTGNGSTATLSQDLTATNYEQPAAVIPAAFQVLAAPETAAVATMQTLAALGGAPGEALVAARASSAIAMIRGCKKQRTFEGKSALLYDPLPFPVSLLPGFSLWSDDGGNKPGGYAAGALLSHLGLLVLVALFSYVIGSVTLNKLRAFEHGEEKRMTRERNKYEQRKQRDREQRRLRREFLLRSGNDARARERLRALDEAEAEPSTDEEELDERFSVDKISNKLSPLQAAPTTSYLLRTLAFSVPYWALLLGTIFAAPSAALTETNAYLPANKDGAPADEAAGAGLSMPDFTPILIVASIFLIIVVVLVAGSAIAVLWIVWPPRSKHERKPLVVRSTIYWPNPVSAGCRAKLRQFLLSRVGRFFFCGNFMWQQAP